MRKIQYIRQTRYSLHADLDNNWRRICACTCWSAVQTPSYIALIYLADFLAQYNQRRMHHLEINWIDIVSTKVAETVAIYSSIMANASAPLCVRQTIETKAQSKVVRAESSSQWLGLEEAEYSKRRIYYYRIQSMIVVFSSTPYLSKRIRGRTVQVNRAAAAENDYDINTNDENRIEWSECTASVVLTRCFLSKPTFEEQWELAISRSLYLREAPSIIFCLHLLALLQQRAMLAVAESEKTARISTALSLQSALAIRSHKF